MLIFSSGLGTFSINIPCGIRDVDVAARVLLYVSTALKSCTLLTSRASSQKRGWEGQLSAVRAHALSTE